MEEVHTVDRTFSNIENYLNKKIKTVYDIGAYTGEWSKNLKNYFPDADFYLFEPNVSHNDSLLKTSSNVFNIALSDMVKEVKFWQNNSSGDSYYKENTQHYDNADFVVLKTDTLDNIITTNNLPLPDFIKIDTQGSELDILRGAKIALEAATIVMLECSLVEYNSNEPDITTVIKEMLKNNFVPFHPTEMHYYGGMLVQIDILFLKDTDISKYEKFI